MSIIFDVAMATIKFYVVLTLTQFCIFVSVLYQFVETREFVRF